MRIYWRCIGVAAGLCLMVACGSSGSSGASGGGTVSAVTTLSSVPDSVLDPQSYDLTTSTVAASVSKSDVKAVTHSTDFSRAGCEANQLKKAVIRNSIMPQMIKCFMEKIEAASGTQAAGNGTYNYWKGDDAMSGVSGPSEFDVFIPRMAIKKDGDALTMIMCNYDEQFLELYISAANNEYSGHVIQIFGDTFKNKLEFETDGTPESFTTASFQQSFMENWEAWGSGYGVATFAATPANNTVSGYNSFTSDYGSFRGSAYAKFDDAEGSAKFQMDEGSYPAMSVSDMFGDCPTCFNDFINYLETEAGCTTTGITVTSQICYNGCEPDVPCCPSLATTQAPDLTYLCSFSDATPYTESFTVQADSSTTPPTLSFWTAATSAFTADVAAVTLPDSGSAPTIAYSSISSEVDCAQSESWTPIVLTSVPDFSECQALEEEMSDWGSGQMCEVLDQEDNAQEQGGAEE